MKKHIKISANGKKTKKLVCPAGQKSQDGRCVAMKSAEKIARKKGSKIASRTKKASAGKQKMAVRAMKKALRKRKAMGK